MVTGEKRINEDVSKMEKVSAILLDIEGTTTSISFVKETLFPFVRENLESYFEKHWSDDELKEDVKLLKEQAKKDEEEKMEGLILITDGETEKETIIKNILWQMDLDRKTTALKQLQGHIWREGYSNGKLKGHVYSDVVPALRKWVDDGRRLFIYSSGSVEAQKLLFGHTEEGDLLSLFTDHFDTAVGAKGDASSYTAIAKSIGCDRDQILFLTDVVKEASAAREAGLQTVLLVREGNAPLTDDDKKEFTTVVTFEELVLESSAKKKKMDEVEKEEKGEKEEEKKEVVAQTETKPEAEKETKEEPTTQMNGDAPEKMEVEAASEAKEEEKVEKTEKEEEVKTAVEQEPEKTEDPSPVNAEKKAEDEDVEVDVVSEEKPAEEPKPIEAEKKKEKEEVEKVEDDNNKNEQIEKEKEEKNGEGKEPEKATEPEKVEEVKEVKEEEKMPETNGKVEGEEKEKVEMNGKAANGENGENGVAVEAITVKKVVEEKPEKAAEVTA